MATPRARWLLSILLFSLSHCFAKEGPPSPPSHLECFIPCDQAVCDVDIHCTWDPRLNPEIPTNYSLHWEMADSGEVHVISETRSSGFIRREHFSNLGDLHVWVESKNQHGSNKSQKIIFNTADIFKPPPPNITLGPQDPLVIGWIFTCDQLQISVGSCDVRHRTKADQVWQLESGYLDKYTLDKPQPSAVLEFQVRCACSTGKTSDWSDILSINCDGIAPVGELDIWRDCGISPTGFDCVLTWKKLPISQACGIILGYEVRLSYNYGTSLLVNLSTAEPSSQLVCEGMQCYLNSSVKDVSSFNVSAYNAHGTAVPSYLAMPEPGKEKYVQLTDLKMNKENLTLSWNLPSEISDNLNEIVMQYKQAGCPPGQEFSWIKVNKNTTTGFFKGQFNNFTPYNISLFAVSHSGEVHHLSSVIAYSLEDTPPKVPSFKVFSIAATEVTLFWEYIPLSQQKGVIQYYQIGVDGQKVHNVSASPQQINNTFELKHLSPGQEYEVWIRAVTAAGPGENATITIKTNQHQNYVHVIVILLVVCAATILGVICCLFCLFGCSRENKACPWMASCFKDKVPDPGNSHIFKQMKHQINDPLTWLCIPISESHPNICMLEIVERQPGAFRSPLAPKLDGLTKSVAEDGCLKMNCHDDQKEDIVIEEFERTDHTRGREYRQMVDSDEERDKEADEDRDYCWNSSEEEEFTGYEKHFMPTSLEIQG